MTDGPGPTEQHSAHRRRKRYSGKYPRRFEDKYKEHSPADYPETIARVLASGKTPAGTHRPIMAQEIMELLSPQPGEIVVDCTLGYGGHTEQFLAAVQPAGRVIAIDTDPIEIRKTEERIRNLGFGPETFGCVCTNFAGLPRALLQAEVPSADIIFADLGVSSMQLDDPQRGFSWKHNGPLDMRLNPDKREPASMLLQKLSKDQLATVLSENADEPHAEALASRLAGKEFPHTFSLAAAVRQALPGRTRDEHDSTIRRVFQAVRIAVNDEFGALEMLLRHLPFCLKPAGRVGILTFHSGEDRRVKKAFEQFVREGVFSSVARDVVRPSEEERRANPRSTAAKFRWATRASSADKS